MANMKQKQKVIILIFLIFLLCDFSYSYRYRLPGDKLVEYCREYEKAERGEKYLPGGDAYFRGYVSGISDAYDEILFNSPLDSKSGQLYAIIVKYLNENPEKWNEPARNLVINALQKAFPLTK